MIDAGEKQGRERNAAGVLYSQEIQTFLLTIPPGNICLDFSLLFKTYDPKQVEVTQAFNSSTQEAETGGFL